MVVDGESRGSTASRPVVGLVCLASHTADPVNSLGYSVAPRGDVLAYCAHGADRNHEWVRVPITPLDQITIAKMEDRPPLPAL